MLKKFAVTNFRGFAERIEWDLSSPSNYEFNTHVVKNGIIKNGIIFGPNGSGKSNFGRAIFDIIVNLTQRLRNFNYYENYVFNGDSSLLLKFEYTFQFDKQTVEYIYVKNAAGILIEEVLTADNEKMFVRNKNKIEFNKTHFSSISKYAQTALKQNANNISIISFLLSSVPFPKNHFLIKLHEFANSMLWFRCLEGNEFMGFEDANANLDEFIIKNNLTEDFEKFIMSVSEQKFTFMNHKPDDKRLYCRMGNNYAIFDMIASTGTKSLRLLYYWIKKMNKASFVFIDEFDAFYHYKLAYEVCQRLFKLNCQVFTSSHNTYLMTNKLLRPDCNFILQNNKIKALQDCTDKELRFGHNIEKLFRGGAFEL